MYVCVFGCDRTLSVDCRRLAPDIAHGHLHNPQHITIGATELDHRAAIALPELGQLVTPVRRQQTTPRLGREVVNVGCRLSTTV